ncbi:mitochondrial antiviral-signaling protein isoform X2 [Pseudophryne corroboree]|uniref:mitochondrial antiviral-signaling protein isoform X2 n=1 Tax=Pseudophryne corroboree TaxID=495146 RepID=UPI003081A503
MGFAEDKFLEYLRHNMILLEAININEMLFHLSGCLTKPTEEKLKRIVNNEGNSNTLLEFVNDLRKRDDWVNHLIRALRRCELYDLAHRFQEIYNSYRPLPSPSSLPSRSHQQPPPYQPEASQRNLSLPPQLQPIPPVPQPGPSRSLNPIQTRQETARSRPSPDQPQESPVIPGASHESFPPSQSRIPLSDSPSTPLSRKMTEDNTARVPVPETEPFQAAPPEDSDEPLSGMATREVPASRNPPQGNHSLSPNLADIIPQQTSRQETSEDSSAAQVTPAQQSPSLHASNEEGAADFGGQPAYHKVDDLHMRSLPRPSTDHRSGVNEPITSPPNREHSVHQPVAGSSGLSSPSGDHRVQANEAGAASQHREPSHHQQETTSNVDDLRVSSLPRPPTDHRSGVNEPITSPPSREHSVHQPVAGSSGLSRPSGDHRVQANEAGAASQHRERSLHQRETTSNDNDEDGEEMSLSKPGVLLSTCRMREVTEDERQVSDLLWSPDLQISDSDGEEGSVSRGVSDRAGSSPTSNADTNTTVTTQTVTLQTSTPNHHSTWRNARKSPEENDFTYAPPDDNLTQQPEENSFELSQDNRSHRIQFNEEPPVDLNEGNISILRHRQPTTPDNRELNERNQYQKMPDTPMGNKLEGPVTITLVVAAVGLSFFLLWKKLRT